MTNLSLVRRPEAVIFGCAGMTLNADERTFFKDCDPLGFILFARNCETPDQVSELVSELRSVVGRDDAPVLIDQEGGRVQRLGPPHWPVYPSARNLVGAAMDTNPATAEEAVRLNAYLIAHDLQRLGIDVDCAPVADVPEVGAHEIIGDRAYGGSPGEVAKLARAACDGLLQGGVLPVIKHIPGHGRARVDSHMELPVVDVSRDDLDAVDFAPFEALSDMPWAMTAHVVYSAIDPDTPATLSKMMINDVIREQIGFDGILISDDLSMQALNGDFRARAEGALAAGCDLALHCNGDMSEMTAVAEGLAEMADEAYVRLKRGAKLRTSAAAISMLDPDLARARLQELTGKQA